MTSTSLAGRVTLETLVLAGALAVPVAWLGGPRAALGVVAGAVLAVLNFRWLVARASAACSVLSTGDGPALAWLISAGLRFVAVAAACAVLLVSGWAHPIGLIVGLTVLPCDLIAQGLRAAPEAG